MLNLLWIVAGLLLLVKGADLLIKGSANIAARFRVPPLLIGLTLVAFGTSSPELAVSVDAALAGQAGVGLGNVVGSNIFNTLFILGLCGVFAPLLISTRLIRRDLPVMFAVSLLAWWLARDGSFSALEGMALTGLLVAYVSYLFWTAKNAPAEALADQPPLAADAPVWRNALLSVAGLALLVLGSKLMVKGAVAVAQWLGVSDLVIGLTLVAAATSLPELVTSLVATLKGQRDLAVGNVVGSNIFNLLGVLGLSAWVAPEPLVVTPSLLAIDLPLMLLAAGLCLPLCFTGRRLSPSEAIWLLALYLAYVAYLVLEAIGNPYSHWLVEGVKMMLLPLGLLFAAQVIHDLKGEPVA